MTNRFLEYIHTRYTTVSLLDESNLELKTWSTMSYLIFMLYNKYFIFTFNKIKSFPITEVLHILNILHNRYTLHRYNTMITI